MLERDQILAERYQVRSKVLSYGAVALYRGRDQQTGAEVILKCLSFASLQNWEQLQQFERESALLQSFVHPRLPRWLDWIERNEGERQTVCLVQTALPGRSLQAILDESGPLDESEVTTLAAQTLCLLQALHSHRPAILHLDLKPSNLLRDEAQRLYLIDFGAAALWGDPLLAVAGTPGFTPPEQLAGQPEPRSDLYALGATCIALLSGLSLSDLIQGHQLAFREHVEGSVAFKNWLEIMVHPDPELRYASAEQALAQLPGVRQVPTNLLPQWTLETGLQTGTQLQLIRTPSALAGPLPQLPPALAQIRLLRYLKQAGGTRTWLAEWCAEGAESQRVIVKELCLPQVESVKEWEYWEREVAALQALQDPRLPQVLAWQQEAESWWLVLSYLEGETLAEKVAAHWQPSEAEIWDFGAQVLQILRRLHAQKPPLLHRDLSPENLLWQPGPEGGQVFLLDFGGAQQRLLTQGSGGSTLTGSFGYTAPEQYVGHSQPVSDLFGLGMCLIYALSQRHPAQFSWDNQEIHLAALQASEPLKNWLQNLTHLDPDRRYRSAEQALVTLQQQREIALANDRQRELHSLEARRERLQQLFLDEAEYASGQRGQTVRSEALAWTERLRALDLTQPPLRLALENQTESWCLHLPFDSTAHQPRLLRRFRYSNRLLRLLYFFLMLGLLGIVIHPFLLAWGGLVLAFGIFWQTRQLIEAYVHDFKLEIQEQVLSWEGHPPQFWQREREMPFQVKKGMIPLKDIQSLTVKPYPAVPQVLAGPFFVLEMQTPAGERICSSPFYARPEDGAWLEMALPRVVDAAQQGLLLPSAAD